MPHPCISKHISITYCESCKLLKCSHCGLSSTTWEPFWLDGRIPGSAILVQCITCLLPPIIEEMNKEIIEQKQGFMTPRDLVYWLQGIFEVGDVKTLNERQVQIIRNHINLVFKHMDEPDLDGSSQAAHDGTPAPVSPSTPFMPHGGPLRC